MVENILSKRDYISIALLFALSFFLFADQNLMGPNLTQIANDFGFNDIERDVKLGGEISLVFWLIGGVVTLFFGYFTDVVSRKKLLIISILAGEIPCFLTGFVETYEQFFWLRALTGIGIGAIIPITYSLIGDYFPSSMRSSITGYLGLVVGLGIAGSMLIATAFGSLVPLLLQRLDVDPAIATGPFVTTSIDILGVSLYLGIANYFLTV